MIDHTGFSVTNLENSKLFYMQVLASLGHIVRLEIPDKAVGFGPAKPDEGADPGGAFWITQGTPSTPRMHLAFSAKNKEEVDAFHSTALQAGGKDNGAPGYRPQYHHGYYAAFILDPDGYNIEAVYHETQ
ncbi:TPA: VOC family protein [Yersinia enterocolitica]|uniref:VOC family protein n=1 Tax=Yersinia enterocolitica TaxID=630 RepID=UPI002AC6AD47|nr:VOC family protein [Yersinia enterocolitica]HDM8438183.1 VOC family protein [Yersinia enterocolitica]HEN3580643.1 VOC family protein [Yersinia enterocolitica]HEN3601182.1 VOC family protein [Yersinia enterocolitica]HEN3610845.1 VOC family protein [Yersinia enterocolitica]